MVVSGHSFCERRGKASFLWCVLACGLVAATATNVRQPACAQTKVETSLHSRTQLLDPNTRMSFPERLIATSSGKAYLLDTDLSILFSVDNKNGQVTRLCGTESLQAPSDFSIDRRGNLWVLSVLHSKIVKLNANCQAQAEVTSRNLPLRVATNASGELIVLNGAGEHLFEMYGPEGKLLRGFGKRLEYKDETTNSELSDGRIAPDNSGGFFFSFNYPPLIRHYSRNGSLISEFRPESEISIDPPNISVRKLGNSTVVRARYQILVLDMVADARGRLFLLLSGKNKVAAITEGTQKLMVLTDRGRLLKKALLENNFHRLAIGNNRLYLLRNRAPFRLDEYPLI